MKDSLFIQIHTIQTSYLNVLPTPTRIEVTIQSPTKDTTIFPTPSKTRFLHLIERDLGTESVLIFSITSSRSLASYPQALAVTTTLGPLGYRQNRDCVMCLFLDGEYWLVFMGVLRERVRGEGTR